MKVELVSITKPVIEGIDTAEELIAYCARVSNPSNQMNKKTATNLLNYLIKHKHWSPFEMASMCVSIETSRAIAAQILRHRSFSFQEFSQRYSSIEEFKDFFEPVELRYSAKTNRQSSSVACDDNDVLNEAVKDHLDFSIDFYLDLLDNGIATETARMVLPLATKTKLYMNGTIRSWIHYLAIRADEHTQKEHRLIAEQVKNLLEINFPTVYKAIYNGKNEA